jgi:AraC-like DNA-binding protein
MLQVSLTTLLLFIALSCLLSFKWKLPSTLLVVLSISVAAITVASLPNELGMPRWLYLTTRIIGLLNVSAFWLFCLSLLRDDFRLNFWLFFGSAALTIPPLMHLLHEVTSWAPGLELYGLNIKNLVGLAFPLLVVCHITWAAVAGYADDLVDSRQSLRRIIVLVCIVAFSVSIGAESVNSVEVGNLIRNSLLMPVVLIASLVLTRFDNDTLSFWPQQEHTEDPTQIDPKDSALHSALIEIMREGRVYQQTELTILKLADQLGTREHRLRSLINQGLGYRNFSSFLAQYRLAYAKDKLSDPDFARESILRISLEAGFASLATFNRVFKQQESVSPREFRKISLSKLSQ